MKQAMHRAAQRTIIATERSKLNTKARHRTLAIDQIDLIITDAEPEQISPYELVDTEFKLV